MCPNDKLQPTFLKNRNKASEVAAHGNNTKIDLENSIENLRRASPILANQIDAMMHDTPNVNQNNNLHWLFLYSQMHYMQEFEKSGKDPDYFAPPIPPNALSISLEELSDMRIEARTFVVDNLDDIVDELENQGSTRKTPTPT